MSTQDGPGEGTWAVFALKVVEERDSLREEVTALKQRIDDLKFAMGTDAMGWHDRAVAAERDRDKISRERDECIASHQQTHVRLTNAESVIAELRPWQQEARAVMEQVLPWVGSGNHEGSPRQLVLPWVGSGNHEGSPRQLACAAIHSLLQDDSR